MGLFIYLLILILLADVILIIGRAVKLIPARSLTKIRFCARSAALLLSFVIVGYGLYHANHAKDISYEVVIKDCLVLIGRLDSRPIGSPAGLRRKDFSKVMAHVNADYPVVVLDHNPENIGEYGAESDLILSGHTHRGQLFTGNLFTKAMFTVDYGHYKENADSPHVIVTQGVSTWLMPVRVGTDNEIVRISAQ
jgi:predicted MPP superfamily phosphohydrolase